MKSKFDRVISADSHVLEPADLWWKAIGRKYGERTPRVLDQYNGQPGRFFYTGRQVLKLYQTEAELEKMGGLVTAGRDPIKRLAFQKEADVQAEVLNPTLMMLTMQGLDREAVRASARAYNDWLADFVSENPSRLLGIAAAPIDDVEWGLKELERVAKRGLKGAMINVIPPEGAPPYRDHYYDPFWAKAQDMDIPITLHSITGRILDPLHFHTPQEFERASSTWTYMFLEVIEPLADDFIFGRILDRFPQLKLICAEWEISWVPMFMFRVDQMQDALAHRIPMEKLKMKASDYVRTRMWHGMIDDPFGRDAVRHIGADGVMWGSDFPHVRSIGLEAHDALDRILAGLPHEAQAKIVGGNARKVFGLH